jgi:hypothetical protein
MRLGEAILELVDEQYVVDLQRRFHRTARNVKRPHHEGDEEQRDEPRDDEGIEVFANDRPRRRRRRGIAGGHPGSRNGLWAETDGDAHDREKANQREKFKRGHGKQRNPR